MSALRRTPPLRGGLALLLWGKGASADSLEATDLALRPEPLRREKAEIPFLTDASLTTFQ